MGGAWELSLAYVSELLRKYPPMRTIALCSHRDQHPTVHHSSRAMGVKDERKTAHAIIQMMGPP